MNKGLSSILSNSYMNSEKVFMGVKKKKKSKNVRLVHPQAVLSFMYCDYLQM